MKVTFRDILAGLVRERGRVERLRGENKRTARVILEPLRERLGLELGVEQQAYAEDLSFKDGVSADLQAAFQAFGTWMASNGNEPNSRNRTAFSAMEWAIQSRLEDRLATFDHYIPLFIKTDSEPRDLNTQVFPQKVS